MREETSSCRVTADNVSKNDFKGLFEKHQNLLRKGVILVTGSCCISRVCPRSRGQPRRCWSSKAARAFGGGRIYPFYPATAMTDVFTEPSSRPVIPS